MVYTPNLVEDNLNLQIYIYSDCFSAYREDDFNALGNVLHHVNHSMWFGQGRFHTNTIKGFLSCLKRLSNDFSGLNFKLLDN